MNAVLTPPVVTSFAQLDPEATYSYADYLSWKFTDWVELLRGKVVRRMSGPADPHQLVAGNFHGFLHYYLRRKRCQVRMAPYDVRLVPGGGDPADAAVLTVVQPDVCVIRDPAKLEHRGCLGAPDLIVEVTSPGTQSRDWKDKFDLYEENGLREYWLADPLAHSLSVFVLDEATAHYRLVGEYAGPGPVPCATLPELNLQWEDVFPAADEPPRDPEAK